MIHRKQHRPLLSAERIDQPQDVSRLPKAVDLVLLWEKIFFSFTRLVILFGRPGYCFCPKNTYKSKTYTFRHREKQYVENAYGVGMNKPWFREFFEVVGGSIEVRRSPGIPLSD